MFTVMSWKAYLMSPRHVAVWPAGLSDCPRSGDVHEHGPPPRDEDQEVIPDAETMEFYRMSVSVIAFCSFAMVTLVGVFWGYIIHGIVHTEGVTPAPTHRNREYLKASAQEEVLRDLDDSDYAVPNLVFLTERSRRRRLRTPVVVLRRHQPHNASQTPSLLTRRLNRTRTFRPRRRAKTTRKPVFQWRSKVLVSPEATSVTDSTGRPPSAAEEESASPSLPPPEVTSGDSNSGGGENALFPGDDVEVGISDGSRETDSSSGRGGLLDPQVTIGDASDNDTSLIGNKTEVTHFAGHVVDNNGTWQDNSTGVGTPQDSSRESSADNYEDDRSDPDGTEEVVSSNALLSEDDERAAKDAVDPEGRNDSLHPAPVGEGARNDSLAMNVTITLKVNVAANMSEAVETVEGVVNATETDYYD
ncbi:hypothetical protein HPB51_025316 [Rhipicephalus microplus]|uniref:Uncharacterized protein n=1 Tax=Rhipicephalus microplus TaxID=6941 RepID=A0A9J6F9M5_RHIMP|nr:hypothetical protein HPB51_025316 [Rhipicephalus microplus]